MKSQDNPVLATLRSDFWSGIPGVGDPYEWTMRAWMDAAANGFSRGIHLPEHTPEQASFAATVIQRLGIVKGIRPAAEVGTHAEIVNAGFGLDLMKEWQVSS